MTAARTRALTQAAGKEIRKHLEMGNVDAAMSVFDAKHKVGSIDLQTATTLIMGLVRACHLAESIQVADYLKERNMKMPLRQFTAIITGMSQRANPMDALEFLNALEHIINYESKAVHNYHFHFMRSSRCRSFWRRHFRRWTAWPTHPRLDCRRADSPRWTW